MGPGGYPRLDTTLRHAQDRGGGSVGLIVGQRGRAGIRGLGGRGVVAGGWGVTGVGGEKREGGPAV